MISQELSVFMDCQVRNCTYAKSNVPNLKKIQDTCEFSSIDFIAIAMCNDTMTTNIFRD